MTNSKRLLILAQDGDSTRIVFNRLRRAFDVSSVVLEEPVPRSQFLQRRVRNLGVRTVVGQLAFRGLLVPLLHAEGRARRREIERQYSLDKSAIDEAMVTRVASVNSPTCHEILRMHAPDVVVVNGTRILSKATLDAVRARFVNIHTGITPSYRGVHGGYWALAQRQPERFGTTIHLVDTGIDTGRILAQAVIQPTWRDNFATYPYLQYAAAMPVLETVIKDLWSGQVRTLEPPTEASRLWSHPTLGQYLANRLRLGVR